MDYGASHTPAQGVSRVTKFQNDPLPYTLARSGWDAANEEADRDGGLMLLTLVICIALSVDY